MSDTQAPSKDQLAAMAREIERLAFQIPPPNPQTPQLVMIAQALQRLAHEPPAELLPVVERIRDSAYAAGQCSAKAQHSEELRLLREVASAVASVMRASKPPVPAPVAPIARLYVAEDDSVTASMYAPGLPPGNHDVYPVPPADDYFDKYTTEHLEAACHFATKLMCDYADRDREDKAALLGTAVDVLSRLAMQRVTATKGDEA